MCEFSARIFGILTIFLRQEKSYQVNFVRIKFFSLGKVVILPQGMCAWGTHWFSRLRGSNLKSWPCESWRCESNNPHLGCWQDVPNTNSLKCKVTSSASGKLTPIELFAFQASGIRNMTPPSELRKVFGPSPETKTRIWPLVMFARVGRRGLEQLM